MTNIPHVIYTFRCVDFNWRKNFARAHCARTLYFFSKVPKICLERPPRGPGDSLLVYFREIFFKLRCGRNDSWWLKPACGFELYKPSSLYDDKVYVIILLLDGDHAFKWQSVLRNFYFASRGSLFTLLCKNMIRLKCNDDIDLFFTGFNRQLSLRPQLIFKKYFSELYQKWVPVVNHRRGPPVPQPPTRPSFWRTAATLAWFCRTGRAFYVRAGVPAPE